MPDVIINMDDMAAIFAVTDVMGIHRESVSVDLTREDPGSINRTGAGVIELTVPDDAIVGALLPVVWAGFAGGGAVGVGRGQIEWGERSKVVRGGTRLLCGYRGCEGEEENREKTGAGVHAMKGWVDERSKNR